MNPAAKEPEPKRGPNAGAQPFGYFLASEKVTRRKGETASRSTRSNGYSPNQNHRHPIAVHKKAPQKEGLPYTTRNRNQVI